MISLFFFSGTMLYSNITSSEEEIGNIQLSDSRDYNLRIMAILHENLANECSQAQEELLKELRKVEFMNLLCFLFLSIL